MIASKFFKIIIIKHVSYQETRVGERPTTPLLPALLLPLMPASKRIKIIQGAVVVPNVVPMPAMWQLLPLMPASKRIKIIQGAVVAPNVVPMLAMPLMPATKRIK